MDRPTSGRWPGADRAADGDVARGDLVAQETPPGRWVVPLVGAAGAAVCAALGFVWLYAPEEAVLGVAHKILYIHVPSAWAMYAATALCAVSSAVFLATRAGRADALAAAGGSVALLFCSVVLVTGPLWARAAWGVWWTWEPRLTSVLVLGLILAGYAVLRRAAERTPRLARFAAALAVLGAADIPLIHLAVRRWRGNHPTVLGRGGGGMTAEMWVALAVCLVAFTMLFVALVVLRYRVEVARREVALLTAEVALRPEAPPVGGGR